MALSQTVFEVQVLRSIKVTISFLSAMDRLHENASSEQFFSRVELRFRMLYSYQYYRKKLVYVFRF